MGVSVSIHGIREANGKLQDMIKMKLLCDKLGVENYPAELTKYFDGTEALYYADEDKIRQAATEVSLQYELRIEGLVDGDADDADGAIIDLEKLPDDIKKLRVFKS